MGRLGRIKRGITGHLPKKEIPMQQQGCGCGCTEFNVYNDGEDIMIISCVQCKKGLKFESHGNIKITKIEHVNTK